MRKVVVASLLVLTAAMFGCSAQTNQALYEAPLTDLGIVGDNTQAAQKIEEIVRDGLANVKPGERPSIETDEAGLWMVMDTAEEKLKTSGHLVRDEALNSYVQGVVCKLVPEYCSSIRVYLIRTPHFNATMAPNGAMQVWTGALLRVQNEAQLAAILGHEIGHYLRRHSLQRMQNTISQTSALVFVQVALALAGAPLASDILTLIVVGNIQAFSRDHEREADGYGLALMTRAGYDPREAAKIWGLLIEEAKADQKGRNESIFLASHPAKEERYIEIKALGEQVSAKRGPLNLGEEQYAKLVQPYRIQYLQDLLHLRNFDRTEKLLNLLLERGGDKDQIHFLKGELYRLRCREGDVQKALAEYEQAAGPAAPPETYRAMGLLYSKTGDKKKAAEAYRCYLQNCPDSADHKIVQQMIQELEQ